MLLSIQHLTVTLNEEQQKQPIIADINLEINPQRVTALVGGSGSGKTTTGLAILRLLSPALQVAGGRIIFQRENILDYSPIKLRALRGKEIGMVFQEPLYAFNPVYPIGFQIEEVLKYHTSLNAKQRQGRILELMAEVGLPNPHRMVNSYPHQLSGGMRQRAMIAQAIAASPKIIIADEPTSNLDVTLQAKIIDLFHRLKNRFQLAILLITHDLGMVSHLADEVAVMNKGKIVEAGLTQNILQNPCHSYTRELLQSFGV